MLDGVLHVGIKLLDELKEWLNLILKHGLEGAVKIDDDLEGQDSIVLVVVAKHVKHGGHEGVGVGLEHLLLWQAMSCLEDDMTETLLWRVCDEAAWCGFEESDVGGDDVLEEEGVVEVLE